MHLNSNSGKNRYGRRIKRWLDLLAAAPLFIILSPIMGVIGLLIHRDIGRPIIFKQDRPGLSEATFTIYKFRTMRNVTDEAGQPLAESVRLTRLGRALRRSSLDELPELLNVIKGEMSIIGPRPLAMKYLPHYTPEERRRHSVRPGITGLAQVKGRNTLQWEERFTYDLIYVDNLTFFLDLRILWLTALALVRRSDVVPRGTGTVGDFDAHRQSQPKEA